MSYVEIVILTADLAAPTPDGTVSTSTTTAGPTAVGYGGIVLGVAIAAYVGAKWKHVNKEAHKMFILGAVIALLLGVGGGIFGMLGQTVRQTGDQVGNTITDTTTGNGAVQQP